MPKNLISIKKIVKKYSIPYSTVNHYTIIGLLTVADRKKNIRFYDEAEVKEKLRRISELRGKGYPLHLIRKELRKTS
jgi:DNA-binding transcriptional MerR regulator